jgi:hypothetical protein
VRADTKILLRHALELAKNDGAVVVEVAGKQLARIGEGFGGFGRRLHRVSPV